MLSINSNKTQSCHIKIITRMLKLTSTIFLLLVVFGSCLTERHELRTTQHEILDTTWITNQYCDSECDQKRGTVCGNVAKQCCDNQGCSSLNACQGSEVPLQCFSYKDSWTIGGGSCLPDCQNKGGSACGNVNIDCCKNGKCQSHLFGAYYTCSDRNKILHVYCP